MTIFIPRPSSSRIHGQDRARPGGIRRCRLSVASLRATPTALLRRTHSGHRQGCAFSNRRNSWRGPVWARDRAWDFYDWRALITPRPKAAEVFDPSNDPATFAFADALSLHDKFTSPQEIVP